MKTNSNLQIILSVGLLLLVSTPTFAERKLNVEIQLLECENPEYHDFLYEIVAECIISNGNFIIMNSDIKKGQHSNKQSTSPPDLLLKVSVTNLSMIKFLVPSYSYVTRETTYSDGFNLEADICLVFIDIKTGVQVFKKSFDYAYSGNFESDVLSSSRKGAYTKTATIITGQICTWMNHEMPSREVVLARVNRASYPESSASFLGFINTHP